MDGFDFVAASDFNDCLLGIHQDDLPSNGFWCTWSNKRSGSNDNKSMIDRVLSNSAWLNEFPLSKEVFLAPCVSDHCSIMVTILPSISRRGSLKFFKF